ncbi:hypothetical protein Q0590_25685 [Rhodocytophaga aerolata]|uniref:Lipoprotein n=1 Tax=Rhodocytophaga aerolata TaxID=455078 RepID=A0ABT8RFX2_9BACT|nr:hypothetical protein [Rhodocytophaga aerolata]MDO1449695.1 hypothetical protein [Rhodocytophaga aerolata]
MARWKLLKGNIWVVTGLLLLASCKHTLLDWNPTPVTDTDDVEIVCNASEGNKGLLNYEGPVYIHVGLITSKSTHKNDWRYVKFNWGSRQREAEATPAGKNKWTYSIKNIRSFFDVAADEQIIKLAILFRSGACIDVYCKTLRNADGSDMYIPIEDKTAVIQSQTVRK